MKKTLLTISSFLLLSLPVFAQFPDDFEDLDASDWTVSGGIGIDLARNHTSGGQASLQGIATISIPANAQKAEPAVDAGETWVAEGWVYRQGGFVQFGWFADPSEPQITSTNTWTYVADTYLFALSDSKNVDFYVQNLGGIANLDDVNTFQIFPVTPTPPSVPDFPDLKLFQSTQSMSSAFNLEDFNTGGVGTTYAIVNNPLAKASIAGSFISQASYNVPTTISQSFSVTNTVGGVTTANKAKYSTYKIQKLPKVGLTAGSSWDVNVASYTISSTGPVVPASFGTTSSIIVSDLSKVTAYWVGSTVVRILSLATSVTPVNVDVIGSPNTGPSFGSDIDKERIVVYSNLLPNSTFSTGNDTTFYGLETSAGKPTLASLSQSNAVADFSGVTANGVITYTFADNQGGVKATAVSANRVPYAAGQWYTVRTRLFSPDIGNTHQALIFNFSNEVAIGGHIDVSANGYFGVPSTWTWIEVPFYSFETGIGYPQYQLKAGAAGSISIDEIQIVNAPPTLVDASRGNTRLKYSFGDFDSSADTTGWGDEGYLVGNPPIQSNRPQFSVSTSLHLNFSGAASGTNQLGMKWTANNGVGGSIYTPSATPGRQVGVKLSLNKASGNFNTVNAILLMANFGVSSNGGADFFSAGGQLIATAEFGRLTNGTHFNAGTARRGFNQFQFAVKNDQAGELDIDNADFISDNDDPNYGLGSLFP